MLELLIVNYVIWYNTRKMHLRRLKMNTKATNDLPKDVEKPQFPNQLIFSSIAAVVLFIGGYLYTPLFSASVVFLVISIGVIVYNKRFKAIYYTRRAISKYKSGNYKESFKLCRRALKYENSYDPAFNLMSWSKKKGKF